MIPACETCQWWVRKTGNTQIGDCRRAPPIVLNRKSEMDGRETAHSVCPVTATSHFCSLHEEKQASG